MITLHFTLTFLITAVLFFLQDSNDASTSHWALSYFMGACFMGLNLKFLSIFTTQFFSEKVYSMLFTAVVSITILFASASLLSKINTVSLTALGLGYTSITLTAVCFALGQLYLQKKS